MPRYGDVNAAAKAALLRTTQAAPFIAKPVKPNPVQTIVDARPINTLVVALNSLSTWEDTSQLPFSLAKGKASLSFFSGLAIADFSVTELHSRMQGLVADRRQFEALEQEGVGIIKLMAQSCDLYEWPVAWGGSSSCRKMPDGTVEVHLSAVSTSYDRILDVLATASRSLGIKDYDIPLPRNGFC